MEQERLQDHLGTFTVTLGPVTAAPEIRRLKAEGYGPTAIARSLNRRGIPTPTGRGRWHPATVDRHINPGPWREYIQNSYRPRRRANGGMPLSR